MRRMVSTLILSGFILWSGHTLWAEDTVYYREPGKKKDASVVGTIDGESPSGIKFKSKLGKKQDIPSLQIVQVEYGNETVAKLDFRKPDSQLFKAIEESKADKKRDGLRAALAGFQELDGGDLRNNTPIHRYLRYRIAQTLSLLARDDDNRREAALAALMDYKTNFADGWEIVPALQLLASLQEEKGDTEGASQTYVALSEVSGISDAMRLQSRLRGARLLMRVRKFAEAEAKLKQAEASMPGDDPQRAFVEVYLLQSRIAQGGNVEGVEPKLQQAVRNTKDDGLHALAHNSLGDFYRLKKNQEQAFWEYCKVDVLYNQDKEEHAKALYYLSQLFDSVRNDRDRAKEVLTRLKSPQFAGTLYQRLALADTKTKE